MKTAILGLILSVSFVSAQDMLSMKNGEKRTGQLVGVDALQYRLQVPLPLSPSAPPGTTPVLAAVSIPRADVDFIEFAPDPSLNALLRSSTPEQLGLIEARWVKTEAWLAIPRSPSARIGNALGDLLLRSGDPTQAQRSLDLFQKIEKEAWSPEDKMIARQGRLRAMVATGNAKGAVNEAIELARITENPVVLIEAKYILGTAADASLKKLLEDNPRWQEDVNVIPERNRLYNEALDYYLYPCLFVGSETEASARGLWGAAGVYRLTGETGRAVECARDIIALYPQTKFAAPASEFLASLTEEQRAEDPEKEARDEIDVSDRAPKSQDSSREETKKKKSNENKQSKKS